MFSPSLDDLSSMLGTLLRGQWLVRPNGLPYDSYEIRQENGQLMAIAWRGDRSSGNLLIVTLDPYDLRYYPDDLQIEHVQQMVHTIELTPAQLTTLWPFIISRIPALHALGLADAQ